MIRNVKQEQEPRSFGIEDVSSIRRSPSKLLGMPLIISYVFLGLIFSGTFLLMLPISHHGDGVGIFVDALFTAVSAVTCTGLVVVDTAKYWTVFGQIVIGVMIFVGALGFMSFATFVLLLFGQRITLGYRLMMREGLQTDRLGGLVGLTLAIFAIASVIQILGSILLFIRFLKVFDPLEAFWQALFHSISAFANAGFVIFPASHGLIFFKTDVMVIASFATLIFIGSISYLVVMDLVAYRLHFRKYTLNSKIVLTTTLILAFVSFLIFYLGEFSSTNAFESHGAIDRIIFSFFQSISARTAGFSLIDMSQVSSHTSFVTMIFMFIGGASASVAGGIKVNTIAVIILAIICALRGRRRVSAFGREIVITQVQRAMVILFFGLLIVFLGVIALCFTDPNFQFNFLLFEAISAFGVVGLSTGIVPDLSVEGRLVLIIMMFVGRLGPIAIGLTLVQRNMISSHKEPVESIVIA